MFTQLKRLTWKAGLLATISSLLAFTIVLAASGDLDTTFSEDGKVTSFPVPTNPGRNDLVEGIAIQANGKIVAVGYSAVTSTGNRDFALTRYNPDGSLDTTFGGDGRQITNFGGLDLAYDVAVQPDGKIVVAGEACNAPGTVGGCDVAMARYKAGGALDPTFSGDGKQLTNFGSSDNSSLALALQPDGKILAAGYMWNGTDTDFALYRYLSNGSLDPSFSGDGRVRFGFGTGKQDIATDLVLQSDGKIVVAGYSGDTNFINSNFAVARLTVDGNLDTTFSGDGRQLTNFGAAEFIWGIAVQPDGRIMVAGHRVDPSGTNGSHFALARYNTNGTLDTSFNGTGKKVFKIRAGADAEAADVIVQLDGKIVVAGVSHLGNTDDFALVRLNPGGSFDTTFSGDGKVTIDFGGFDSAIALALQPLDGKYVLGGYTSDGTQYDFALARVLP